MSFEIFYKDKAKNIDENYKHLGLLKSLVNRSNFELYEEFDEDEIDQDDSEDEVDEDRVDVDSCEENVINNMKYNQEMKSDILFGLSNEHGCVTNSIKCLVDKRFKNKTLHVYATSFRSAMCYLNRLQIENRVFKGMALQLAIKESEKTFCTLNLKAFLFENIPSRVIDKDRDFEKIIARLNWNTDLDKILKTIRYREDFVSAQEKITARYLDDNLMMPRPLRVKEANKTPVVLVMISIFAAIRIHQDNVSPETAFDLVIKSKGIDAKVFFG